MLKVIYNNKLTWRKFRAKSWQLHFEQGAGGTDTLFKQAFRAKLCRVGLGISEQSVSTKQHLIRLKFCQTLQLLTTLFNCSVLF